MVARSPIPGWGSPFTLPAVQSAASLRSSAPTNWRRSLPVDHRPPRASYTHRPATPRVNHSGYQPHRPPVTTGPSHQHQPLSRHGSQLAHLRVTCFPIRRIKLQQCLPVDSGTGGHPADPASLAASSNAADQAPEVERVPVAGGRSVYRVADELAARLAVIWRQLTHRPRVTGVASTTPI